MQCGRHSSLGPTLPTRVLEQSGVPKFSLSQFLAGKLGGGRTGREGVMEPGGHQKFPGAY